MGAEFTALVVGLLGLAAAVVAGCGSSQAGETVTVAGGTTTVTETATEEAPAETVTVTKPPPSSGVKVSYGEWEGLFKIHGARLVSRYGTPSVLGQFEYLGAAAVIIRRGPERPCETLVAWAQET